MSTADLNFLNLNTLFVLLSQIVFEAIRGSSIRSDIAIDDVILEGGPCPGKQTETSYKKRKHAIKDFRFVTTSCLLNFFLQKWGSAPLWEPPMRSSKVQGVKTAYNAYPPPPSCFLHITDNSKCCWVLTPACQSKHVDKGNFSCSFSLLGATHISHFTVSVSLHCSSSEHVFFFTFVLH